MNRLATLFFIGCSGLAASCGLAGPKLSEPAQGCLGVAQQLLRSPDSIKVVDAIGDTTPIGEPTPVILDLRADNAFGTPVAVKVICEMDKAPATKHVLKAYVDGVEVDGATLYAAQVSATLTAMRKVSKN